MSPPIRANTFPRLKGGHMGRAGSARRSLWVEDKTPGQGGKADVNREIPGSSCKLLEATGSCFKLISAVNSCKYKPSQTQIQTSKSKSVLGQHFENNMEFRGTRLKNTNS